MRKTISAENIWWIAISKTKNVLAHSRKIIINNSENKKYQRENIGKIKLLILYLRRYRENYWLTCLNSSYYGKLATNQNHELISNSV